MPLATPRQHSCLFELGIVALKLLQHAAQGGFVHFKLLRAHNAATLPAHQQICSEQQPCLCNSSATTVGSGEACRESPLEGHHRHMISEMLSC